MAVGHVTNRDESASWRITRTMSPKFKPFSHESKADIDMVDVGLVSFYMSNIPEEARDLQAKVFDKMGAAINQVLFTDTHAKAIDRYISENLGFKYFVIFDIDAIPLEPTAIKLLIGNAQNCLVGTAHEASHVTPKYPFAGPECICFSTELFSKLGCPSFQQTKRGDVGAELTLIAQEKGLDVSLIWPSHVAVPKWKLGADMFTGAGTTYEDLIYHNYEARYSTKRFVAKCKEILADGPAC